MVMTEDMYSYQNNHNRRIKINGKERILQNPIGEVLINKNKRGDWIKAFSLIIKRCS